METKPSNATYIKILSALAGMRKPCSVVIRAYNERGDEGRLMAVPVNDMAQNVVMIDLAALEVGAPMHSWLIPNYHERGVFFLAKSCTCEYFDDLQRYLNELLEDESEGIYDRASALNKEFFDFINDNIRFGNHRAFLPFWSK